MKHEVIIKTFVNKPNRILLKLYKNNIKVIDSFIKNDELYIKVSLEDYQKIKKELVTINFDYVTDTGFFKVKKSITPLKVFAFILFILTINFFSNIIVNVEVIHSNKEIRELVKKSLDNKGIHPWSLKKDYNSLKQIKENILNENKERLEWLEIENVGMKYVIRIEERINKIYTDSNDYCHIVAKKSGIIDNILSTKGEVLVNKGKYVNEGDILISGEIKFNDVVKNDVCADGIIYAEVWYETHISLPLEYDNVVKTNKKRYNLSFESESGNYKLFRSRLKNYKTRQVYLFNFFNFTFFLDIEEEVVITKNKYTENEAIEEAKRLAREKINANRVEKERIIEEKVLKNTLNDSTIEVDVFYAVLEIISTQVKYTKTIEKEGS